MDGSLDIIWVWTLQGVMAVMSQCLVVHQAAYAGRARSSSTFASRFLGDESAWNALTSSGVGRVPVTSRLTRRRNSASVQTSDGTTPSLLSLATTSRSTCVGAATSGYFGPTCSETGRMACVTPTPLS